MVMRRGPYLFNEVVNHAFHHSQIRDLARVFNAIVVVCRTGISPVGHNVDFDDDPVAWLDDGADGALRLV